MSNDSTHAGTGEKILKCHHIKYKYNQKVLCSSNSQYFAKCEDKKPQKYLSS